MRNFEIYEPIDNITTQDVKMTDFKKSFAKQKYMVNWTIWIFFSNYFLGLVNQ